MHGYIGKMLFIDLTEGRQEVRDLSEDIAYHFLGGQGLGAKILYDEMKGKTDPFSPDSMLGFVSGPLNGLQAFFGGRYTVVSKSPVTNGWNEANSGGHFGPYLKRAGYDAVFVKGRADKPVYIFINNGEVEIRDARHLWGLTVSEAEAALKAEIGDNKINAALIGPGGENLSYMAAIMNDTHRAAGRGGSGAIMGSKKLKALVVKGSYKAEAANKGWLMECNKKVQEFMKAAREGDTTFAGMLDSYGDHGTGSGYVGQVLSGDASVKNWAGAGIHDFPEDVAYKLSTPAMDPKYKIRKYACSSCPLGCGAIYKVEDLRWPLERTARPEYETIGAFGSQMLNKEPASVIKCNDLCNEYGLDTISVGATIAWAMECYDNAVLSRAELDDIELSWGNSEAIVEMTKKICCSDGIGSVLALGSQAAADKLGKGHEYLVVVGGIEVPQHDVRFAPGLARQYQYDPTPGRHVQGGLGVESGFDPPEIKYNYRFTGYKDALGVSRRQIVNAAGFCMFTDFCVPEEVKIEMIMASTGFKYTRYEEYLLGVRIFTQKHAFNLREGMRKSNWWKLPHRMVTGADYGPLAGIGVDSNLLAYNFFNAIGWDENCVPLRTMLEMTGGLQKVIADLY